MTPRPIGRGPARPDCEVPILMEEESGRRWTIRCRATSHDRCRPCAKSYRTKVFWVADSGRTMYPGDTILMVTLTAPSEKGQHCRRHANCDGRRGEDCSVCECTPEGGVHLGEWNAGCSAQWNRFVEALRRLTGVKLQYFRAAEAQCRGALHFHVLFRLPKSRGIRISVAEIRRLAMHFGFGHSVDLSVVNDKRASSYVAKYVSKSCADRAEMPWVNRRTGEVTSGNGRYRCWTSSRRWGWTMALVRQQQADWVQERLRAQAAQPPEPGALDSNGLRYESLPLPGIAGGGL
jgi:hypothetical protein